VEWRSSSSSSNNNTNILELQLQSIKVWCKQLIVYCLISLMWQFIVQVSTAMGYCTVVIFGVLFIVFTH